MIKRLIKEGKEALVTKWINSQIEDYGKVCELEIDTSKKLVQIELLLKGENNSVKVSFYNYEIQKIDSDTYISIKDIITEREWLDLLISRYIDKLLPQKRIKLPSKLVKRIVKLLL